MPSDLGRGGLVHDNGSGRAVKYIEKIGKLLHGVCCGNSTTCTESSKPEPGANAKKLVRCTDSGKLYVSDGAAWHEVKWGRICPTEQG